MVIFSDDANTDIDNPENQEATVDIVDPSVETSDAAKNNNDVDTDNPIITVANSQPSIFTNLIKNARSKLTESVNKDFTDKNSFEQRMHVLREEKSKAKVETSEFDKMLKDIKERNYKARIRNMNSLVGHSSNKGKVDVEGLNRSSFSEAVKENAKITDSALDSMVNNNYNNNSNNNYNNNSNNNVYSKRFSTTESSSFNQQNNRYNDNATQRITANNELKISITESNLERIVKNSIKRTLAELGIEIIKDVKEND